MSMPGGFEWVVIIIIALIVFGPRKLPQIGEAIGKSIREFRRAASGIGEELHEAAKEAREEPKPTAVAHSETATATATASEEEYEEEDDDGEEGYAEEGVSEAEQTPTAQAPAAQAQPPLASQSAPPRVEAADVPVASEGAAPTGPAQPVEQASRPQPS